MRGTILAVLSALLALPACSHSQKTGVDPAAGVQANLLKHSVRPIELSPELESASVPTVFEQVFCSAMFELNDKQVVCSDQVKAFIQFQSERATTSGESMSMEEVAKAFDAPREVVMTAGLSGEVIVLTAVVLDREANALGRFQANLAKDGGDVSARARELAAQIVSLPK
jgi:hypothetical protein